MKTRAHLLRIASVILLCAGCNDDRRLAGQAKGAATAQQWHAWAAGVLARSKTNSNPFTALAVASFHPTDQGALHRLAACYGTKRLNFEHFAGVLWRFCSYSIDVGDSTFTEPPNPNEHRTKVHPGVYVVSN